MGLLPIEVERTNDGVLLTNGTQWFDIDWSEMEAVIQRLTAVFNAHISKKGVS